MLELINGKVNILPEHTPFFKDVSKKELQEVITYLYHFYLNKEFSNLLPTEKREIIIHDYTPKINLEAHSEIISKFERVCLTSTQKLALAHSKKVEDIIQVFYDTPVTVENIEDQAKMAKSIGEMYKLQTSLDALLAKESKSNKGKGSKEISEAEEDNFNDV